MSWSTFRVLIVIELRSRRYRAATNGIPDREQDRAVLLERLVIPLSFVDVELGGQHPESVSIREAREERRSRFER
ncbi:MAG: hypothetical protein ACYS22_13755 [Planctomycetota bacterium]